MHMFALLPGTPPSLSSYQRVGWSFSFQQEHWEHVKLGLAATELSFHLRRDGGAQEGGVVGHHPSAKACARGGPSSGRDLAGTPLPIGAEKLAPLGRREQALTRPYSSQWSREQIEFDVVLETRSHHTPSPTL